MITDEVVIADPAEEAAKGAAQGQPSPDRMNTSRSTDPDTGFDMEPGGFLEELARSQSQKKLDLVGEIEEQVKVLAQHLEQRIQAFLQSSCMVSFTEMVLFQDFSSISPKISDSLLAQAEIEDIPVGCFLIENASARNLLSAGLTGKTTEARSNANLAASERRLFLVVADLLTTALYESLDSVTGLGVPGKPEFMEADDFLEQIEGEDWICFHFVVEFAGHGETLALISPLALYNGQGLRAQELDREEVVVDTQWQALLFDQIENLKVPLVVELGSIDLSLSQIEGLRPGQTLGVKIDPARLCIFTDQGQALVRGSLEKAGNDLEIKINEKVA